QPLCRQKFNRLGRRGRQELVGTRHRRILQKISKEDTIRRRLRKFSRGPMLQQAGGLWVSIAGDCVRYRLLAALILMAWQGCSSAPKSRFGFEEHPAAAIFHRFYDGQQHSIGMNSFQPTGLSRRDYLTLIEPNVDFW